MGRVKGKYSFILAGLVIAIFGNGSVLPAGEGFISSPLPVRNMYAPMMRFLDPVPDSALRDYSNWDIGLNQHISNTIMADQWPANQLLVDMELYVADLTVRKSLTRDMDISVQLSGMRPFNGIFDPLVNSVHDLLSVPAMGRTFRPNNSFAYYFRPGSGSGWQGKARWEVGDAVITLRKELLHGDGWAVAGLAAGKAPLASENRGWGSGKPDAGLGAVASFAGDNLFMHMEAWGIYTFAKDVPAGLFPSITYNPYARGSATLGWKFSDRLALVLQGQGGTSPYSSGLGQLDDPLFIYSLGLQGETDSGTGWTLVFTENGLTQQTTQDFTITLAMHWQFSD